MQTTFIFIKPDAMQRGLASQILARFERKGLQIVGCKLVAVSRELAEAHYAEHIEKPFFNDLCDFVCSSPVLAVALRGVDAISVCRTLIGATLGRTAAPGTIRGDFGMSGTKNLVHGSDSPESAARELGLWFKDGEITDWDHALHDATYAPFDLK